jgi:glycosidase
MPALDGIMNMFAREVILQTSRGAIPPDHAGEMLERMVADVGIVPLLKSWVILDNHDTQRLATSIPDADQRHIAQVLQFSIPGAPCVYYGVEVGMTGGDDPEQRGPMRWDLVDDDNEELRWMQQLIAIRNAHPALRYGDFLALDTRKTLGFVRRTDRAAESLFIFANPGDEEVVEIVPIRDGKMMSFTSFENLLETGGEAFLMAGLLKVTVPARSAMILRPIVDPPGEYTPYKRVQ